MHRALCLTIALLAVAACGAPNAGAQEPPPAPTGTERARITWDKGNDIDLHVYDDQGGHAYWANPNGQGPGPTGEPGISDATLTTDVTTTGGPEIFSDQREPSTRHFRYEACYYSEGAAAADQGPTLVTVTLTDPDGRQRVSSVTLPPPAFEGDLPCAAIGESPIPPPPDPEPTPTPDATPTPTPAAPAEQQILGTLQAGPPPPVQGSTVNVGVVEGKVLIRLRGSNRFVALAGADQIPVGSTVDATNGRVRLTSAADKKGATKVADFYDGAFSVRQSKGSAITELRLEGGRFAACPKASGARASAKQPVRRLWGSGKGAFRTRGRHAAATVRGTQWLTEDTCEGTRVRVKKGVVTVRDLVKRKTVIVKTGKSYLARARR